MMDRRTQRLVLLLLFFGVAVVLYTSVGSSRGEYVVPRGGAQSSGMDLKDLEPANATLGVGCRIIAPLRQLGCQIEC